MKQYSFIMMWHEPEIRYPKNFAKLKGAAVRITGNKPEGKNTMKEKNIGKNQKKKKK